MSAWDRLWKKFDELFDALPDAIDEAVSGRVPGVTSTTVNNGRVEIRGRVVSLKINGYEIRLPDYVVSGKPKR